MSHLPLAAVFLLLLTSLVIAADSYPHGPEKPALDFPHFPSRLHTFVFRNWGLVPADRLARVLRTDPAHVTALATSMGLDPNPDVPSDMLTRGYITLLRRNWHLLPYEQLEQLLDLTPDRLAEHLREDDFLWVKLGQLKPRVAPLTWSDPDAPAQQRAAEIARIVRDELAAVRDVKPEPRFAFLRQFQAPVPEADFPNNPPDPRTVPPRYCYSYFAVFGDPLLDASLDPYPDALLKQLADLGVTGVWLHVVLRDLAPGGPAFPEFGRDHEKRLQNLARLVARARRFGIGVYLYINEPRAMPAPFFDARPDLAGAREHDLRALCTTRPEVRDWLRSALAHVFRIVPDTAGVFTITGSENFTHCASHQRPESCPRCSKRDPADIIAELNTTIAAGVHDGNPAARVIVWDWGWPDAWAPRIIAQLPQDAWFQSVSEWSLPLDRGGVHSTVGEYSLSAVGPGPRATRHWALARQRGLKTVAKVQLNTTWELASIPSLPVLDLVAQHCKNLNNLGNGAIDGYMLSWSLGGYPSPNLDIARRFNADPAASIGSVLNAVATAQFGPGAADARQAWTRFSRAFENYPFHGNVIYRCPVQLGPANLLYAAPTGYSATMVGIPYDDAKGWSAPYPPATLTTQFEKLANEWDTGLPLLQRAATLAPPHLRPDADAALRYATVASIHFHSVANQTRFATTQDPAERLRLVESERTFARQLLPLAMTDSRIGYEASNHYFYVPQDLLEKLINCDYLAHSLQP